jgi:hypothetical protein
MSWSVHYWKTIDMISNQVPEVTTKEQKESLESIFLNIGKWLPCAVCTKHYLEFIKSNPLIATGRREVKTWIKKLKEDISKKQGKK